MPYLNMENVRAKEKRMNTVSTHQPNTNDLKREQETLYVLQNQSLMRQIAASSVTHAQCKGYMLTDTEFHAIFDMTLPPDWVSRKR